MYVLLNFFVIQKLDNFCPWDPMHVLKNLIQSTMQNLITTFDHDQQIKKVRCNDKSVNLIENFQSDIIEEECQYFTIELSKKQISHSDRFDSIPSQLKQFEKEMGMQVLFDSSNVFKVSSCDFMLKFRFSLT